MKIPHWQLPPGVSPGTWDYVNHPAIAEDYDDFFAINSLFEHDERVLSEEFQPPGLIADLGCGTGRALVPLCRRGYRGLAVDLSTHMLRVVMEKAALDGLDITPVKANLVQLHESDPPIADASVDHAMCLFSTLGMIRGHDNRLHALGHVRRVLKPGGRFVLHVHNYWFTLHDPGGWLWVAKNIAQATFLRDTDIGDRYFPYRGLPTMYLHTFRPRELRGLLRSAGFKIRRWIPLEVTRKGPLPHPWWFESLRANGWIVVAE